MKLSIITPALNAEEFIERTLQSIWSANDLGSRADLEHIVVDGESTDATVDIVSRYPSKVLTGRDGGMYEAINKGLEAATGDVFGYVNSDDEVAAGALSLVVDAFERHPDREWLIAPMIMMDAEGSDLAMLRPPRWLSATRFRALGWNCLPQPSTFYRTEFARSLGGFDSSYRLIADYDFAIRARDAERPIYVGRPLTRFRLHETNLSKDHEAMSAEGRRLGSARGIPTVRRALLKWTTKAQINLTNPRWALGKRSGRVRY